MKSPKWERIQSLRASTGGACHPPNKSQDAAGGRKLLQENKRVSPEQQGVMKEVISEQSQDAASGRKLLQENKTVSPELQGVMKELRALRAAKEELGAKVEELERSLMAPPALEPPAGASKKEVEELRQQLAPMKDSVLRLTEENHQLASALRAEQLERAALARKLGQLEEKLCQITALEYQAPLPRGLRQQKGQHQRLAHLAALTQFTPAEGAPTPRSNGDRVPTGKLQEEAATKERAGEREHHCPELREEPGDTEPAAIYPREWVVGKEEGHQVEEEEEEEEKQEQHKDEPEEEEEEEKEQGEEEEEKEEQNKDEKEEEEKEREEKEEKEKQEQNKEEEEVEEKEEEEEEEKQCEEEEKAQWEKEEEKSTMKMRRRRKKNKEEEEEKQEQNEEEEEQGEKEEQEEQEEVEEDENAEEEEKEAEREKQQYSSPPCPGQEALQQVSLRQDDGRSCQGQLVAAAQTRGEEPTAGPRRTRDVATAATEGGPPEGSPAHPEEPAGEEAQVGSSAQPQLPESENTIRAQSWALILRALGEIFLPR